MYVLYVNVLVLIHWNELGHCIFFLGFIKKNNVVRKQGKTDVREQLWAHSFVKKEKEASMYAYYIKYTQSDLFADKTFSRATKDPNSTQDKRYSSWRLITMIMTMIIQFYKTQMKQIRVDTLSFVRTGELRRSQRRVQAARCLFIKAIALPFHHTGWVRTTNERTDGRTNGRPYERHRRWNVNSTHRHALCTVLTISYNSISHPSDQEME